MYCGHCGKEIEDNSKFCKYCGGANIGDNTYTGEAHVTAPKRVWMEKKNILIALMGISTLFSVVGWCIPCFDIAGENHLTLIKMWDELHGFRDFLKYNGENFFLFIAICCALISVLCGVGAGISLFHKSKRTAIFSNVCAWSTVYGVINLILFCHKMDEEWLEVSTFPIVMAIVALLNALVFGREYVNDTVEMNKKIYPEILILPLIIFSIDPFVSFRFEKEFDFILPLLWMVINAISQACVIFLLVVRRMIIAGNAMYVIYVMSNIIAYVSQPEEVVQFQLHMDVLNYILVWLVINIICVVIKNERYRALLSTLLWIAPYLYILLAIDIPHLLKTEGIEKNFMVYRTAQAIIAIVVIVGTAYILFLVKRDINVARLGSKSKIQVPEPAVVSQPAGEIYAPVGNVSNRKTVLGIAVAAMTLFESIGWLLPCVGSTESRITTWQILQEYGEHIWWNINEGYKISHKEGIYVLLAVICIGGALLTAILFLVTLMRHRTAKTSVSSSRACAGFTIGWCVNNIVLCISENRDNPYDYLRITTYGWILLAVALLNALVLVREYEKAAREEKEWKKNYVAYTMTTQNWRVQNESVFPAQGQNIGERQDVSQTGSEAVKRCPQCGNINAGDNMFCGKCGSRLQG